LSLLPKDDYNILVVYFSSKVDKTPLFNLVVDYPLLLLSFKIILQGSIPSDENNTRWIWFLSSGSEDEYI
jgi:hypothetical protein